MAKVQFQVDGLDSNTASIFNDDVTFDGNVDAASISIDGTDISGIYTTETYVDTSIQTTLQNVQAMQGIQGISGSDGIQGPTGPQGVNGVQGTNGIQGLQGTLGVQGITGLQGTNGSGSQGTTGIQGNTGIQGSFGFQGTQGLQGTFGPATVMQTTSSIAYTVTSSDNGKMINITSGGVTISSTTGFTAGQNVVIFNNSLNPQTITSSGITLYLAGTTTTGNRTLTPYGVATVLCYGLNNYVIAGSGLS